MAVPKARYVGVRPGTVRMAGDLGPEVPVGLRALSSASMVIVPGVGVPRAFGTTPLAYVQALRMDSAKHRLPSSDRSVEEVAAEVGYRDPAYFRRLFRTHTGRTPRQVRGGALD